MIAKYKNKFYDFRFNSDYGIFFPYSESICYYLLEIKSIGPFQVDRISLRMMKMIATINDESGETG